MDLIGTLDRQAHLNVLDDAHEIFVKKDAVRGDMWREFPPSDKIRELGERVRRIEKAYDRVSAGHLPSVAIIREDALDLINYSVFLIRQLDEGARG